MADLATAIQVALTAHAGQQDKAGRPYILHPLRLMLRMSTPEDMIVAVLHDVVEDSQITRADLERMGFAEPILDALDALTHREEQSYEDYIAAIKQVPLARRVKLADLEDNSNILRLSEVTQASLERLQKYHTAWQTLKEE
ncbi:MAG: phosphohydrolase [Anaerolineales bacterium]|nr:phosphohydrolase [Anaerolineales bacterium]MCW5839242.1 phosphohydrolase [Anaerolineales bacterium]